MATTRRQFTSDFKIEAVRLVTESGRSVAHAARELGIRPDMLRNWKRQAEGRAGLAPRDASLARVTCQVKRKNCTGSGAKMSVFARSVTC